MNRDLGSNSRWLTSCLYLSGHTNYSKKKPPNFLVAKSNKGFFFFHTEIPWGAVVALLHTLIQDSRPLPGSSVSGQQSREKMNMQGIAWEKFLGATPESVFLHFTHIPLVTEPHLTAREDGRYGLCVQEEREMRFNEHRNKYLCHTAQFPIAKTSSYIKRYNNYAYFIELWWLYVYKA